MEKFVEFLEKIDDELQRVRVEEVLEWVKDTFPTLETKYAWKQPMFTDHETFIIGFSVAKKHISIAPEARGMEIFADKIKSAGYGQTKLLFRIEWGQEVNYDLMKEIITFNIEDKEDCETFWRK